MLGLPQPEPDIVAQMSENAVNALFFVILIMAIVGVISNVMIESRVNQAVRIDMLMVLLSNLASSGASLPEVLRALSQFLNDLIWAPLVRRGIRESDFPMLRENLPEEVFMFAAVIYGEVGDYNYPRDEWIAVGWAIRNRVEDRGGWGWSWPNTFRGVITDNRPVRQYDAFGAAKYRAAMNFYLGYNRYANPGSAVRSVMLDCLTIAIGIYYNVVYTTDLSQGADTFWQGANAPNWGHAHHPAPRTNTPRAMTEGGTWRHTFWRTRP